MSVSRHQTFKAITHPENIGHPVSVPEFHYDPAYDVIQTRAQTTAGDDSGSCLCGIKIDTLTRASDLEGRRRLMRMVLGDFIDAIVTNDLIRIIFEISSSCSLL